MKGLRSLVLWLAAVVVLLVAPWLPLAAVEIVSAGAVWLAGTPPLLGFALGVVAGPRLARALRPARKVVLAA